MTDQLNERQQVHTLIDLLPAGKLHAVRGLLEAMVDPDDEELTAEDQADIDRSREWLKQNKPIPHDEVLAEFGLTMADFPLKT